MQPPGSISHSLHSFYQRHVTVEKCGVDYMISFDYKYRGTRTCCPFRGQRVCDQLIAIYRVFNFPVTAFHHQPTQ